MERKGQSIGVGSSPISGVGIWLSRYGHRGVCGYLECGVASANKRLTLLRQDILEAYEM